MSAALLTGLFTVLGAATGAAALFFARAREERAQTRAALQNALIEYLSALDDYARFRATIYTAVSSRLLQSFRRWMQRLADRLLPPSVTAALAAVDAVLQALFAGRLTRVIDRFAEAETRLALLGSRDLLAAIQAVRKVLIDDPITQAALPDARWQVIVAGRRQLGLASDASALSETPGRDLVPLPAPSAD